MEFEEKESIPVIILEPGSWMIKIGFADDDLPKFQIPCLYVEKTFTNSKNIKFGNEAIEDYTLIKYGTTKIHKKEKTSEDNINDELLNIKMIFADPRHPLSKHNFTDLFEIYNHLINKLNIRTNDFNLLVVIPETIEKLFISNLLNWAFMRQKFLSISLIYNSLAASYYYGLKTAIVIDLGESGSRIVPIAESFGIFFDNMRNCEIGGYLISKYISNFIKINDNYIDYIIIQKYKELNSYVSLDIENNIKVTTECNGLLKPFKIPYTNFYIDPKVEILSHEIYFQPEFLAHLPGNFYKQNIISLSQIIFESVSSCPLDLRKKLLNNIILIGGASNCINISERLHNELVNILRYKKYSESVKINVKQIRMSDIASYLGCKKYGKILFYNKKKWVTCKEYFSSPKNKVINKLLMWANVL